MKGHRIDYESPEMKEKWAKAMQLRAQGVKFNTVCEEVGISKAVYQTILWKEGLWKSRQGFARRDHSKTKGQPLKPKGRVCRKCGKSTRHNYFYCPPCLSQVTAEVGYTEGEDEHVCKIHHREYRGRQSSCL